MFFQEPVYRSGGARREERVLGNELTEELNDAAVYASWKKAIIFGIEEMLVMGNSISTDAYGTNRGVERGPVCASWPSMVQIGNPERSLMGLVSQVRPKPKG